MVFEIAGFICGMAGIGVAWALLLRHERDHVLDAFYRRDRMRQTASGRFGGRSF